MRIQSQNLIIAALIAFCVCAAAVSAVTISTEGGAIAMPGMTGQFPVKMDSLPAGLTGFNISVALSDPAKAEITGVIFPSWAGDGLVIAGKGPLPADAVWVTVVDLYDNVQPGATNIELARLEIRGDSTGSTDLLLTALQIDDEFGNPVTCTIANGTITIGSSPPPIVNGTLDIQSNPTGADVRLDGVYQGTTPILIPNVSAGDHTLRIEKSGYYPWENLITVTAGVTNPVSAALTEIPPAVVNGTVQVQSTPSGADVILDGTYQGLTPMTIPEVGAGVHTLRLEKEGYYPHQESITVNAGLTTNVTWILTEIPPAVVNGTVQVQSTPSGADVILDGTYQGLTPMTIPEVGAGVHTLRLEKEGYYPWENPVIVVAGETTTVVASLSSVPPVNGSIAVQSDPEGANVYLDTEFIGLSPVSIAEVVPGQHIVRLEKDGYESREVNTTVLAGATTIVSVALVPLPPPTTGSLEVLSDPSGSNVFIDTVFKGITPLPVSELDPGLHTVRVERDGYFPYENTSVMIVAGEITQVFATLEPIPIPQTGGIELDSNPSGAAVYIDDVLKGTTPLVIVNLDPQSYHIRVEYSGYLTWEENVTVVAGEIATVFAELTPIPTPTPTPTQTPTPIPTTVLKGTGGLLVVSDPTATVFIDGKERGKSNEVISDVTGGTRNVTLVKAEYKTISFPVTIPVTRVAITPKILLEPVDVPSTPPTTVPTTIPTTLPTLPPTTIIPTTSPTSPPFPSLPTTGSIFVYSIPFGCSVSIDGTVTGTSPGVFSLISPGVHELRITRAGYYDAIRSVTVQQGDITTVAVIMIPDLGSIVAAFP